MVEQVRGACARARLVSGSRWGDNDSLRHLTKGRVRVQGLKVKWTGRKREKIWEQTRSERKMANKYNKSTLKSNLQILINMSVGVCVSSISPKPWNLAT